jgi:hypothetical protein
MVALLQEDGHELMEITCTWACHSEGKLKEHQIILSASAMTKKGVN